MLVVTMLRNTMCFRQHLRTVATTGMSFASYDTQNNVWEDECNVYV